MRWFWLHVPLTSGAKCRIFNNMNWYVSSFDEFPYKIKSEISALLDGSLNDEEAIPEFKHYFMCVFLRKQNVEKHLARLIERFPQFPHFQMLMAESGRAKQTPQSKAAMEALVQIYPSQLYGLSYGLYLGKEVALPAAFADKDAPELWDCFPHRATFHPFEAWLFEHGLLTHLFRTGKAALAKDRLARLKSMSPTPLWDGLVKAMENPGKAKPAPKPAPEPKEEAKAKAEPKSEPVVAAKPKQEPAKPKAEAKAKPVAESKPKLEPKAKPVQAATKANAKAEAPKQVEKAAANAKPAASAAKDAKAKKAPAKGKS